MSMVKTYSVSNEPARKLFRKHGNAVRQGGKHIGQCLLPFCVVFALTYITSVAIDRR